MMNQPNIPGIVWRRRVQQRTGKVPGDLAVGVVMVLAALTLVYVAFVS